MKPLIKISFILILIALLVFGLKVYFAQPESTSDTFGIPAGSGLEHVSGELVPTSVGFDPEDVQPLDTVLLKEPGQKFKPVLDLVHLDVYAVYPCESEETNVFMLTPKAQLDAELYSYRASREAIAQWEPYLLSDIGHFIFPKQTLPPASFLEFRMIESIGMRRAPISVSDSGYIYAAEHANYVFYGASLPCVENAMDAVYDAH